MCVCTQSFISRINLNMLLFSLVNEKKAYKTINIGCTIKCMHVYFQGH